MSEEQYEFITKVTAEECWDRLKNIAKDINVPLDVMLGNYMTHEYNGMLLEVQIETTLILAGLNKIYSKAGSDHP